MKHRFGPLCAALALAPLAGLLAGCDERAQKPAERPAFVRTAIVQSAERQTAITLTGEVQARFRADLSFRVSGRVLARLVDVGSHVEAGQVLARLEPTEQQADVDAATAAVAAAESQLRVAKTAFERQKALIADGFTTRIAFDQAQEDFRRAEAALEAANSQLGTARDALGHTELRAGAAGVITARNLEIGQVVQAAQPVFSLAQDGERDAVFEVSESMFFDGLDSRRITLKLVSDPAVTASGHIREVSPAVDPRSATVRVKVSIDAPPAQMELGSAVAGTAGSAHVAQLALPWTALMAAGAKPAVWVVEPSGAVSLQPVEIAEYEAGEVVIERGLQPGQRVVVEGGKLLSSGQPVTYDRDPS
jgi:RND family efflux transporter MFP subunit